MKTSILKPLTSFILFIRCYQSVQFKIAQNDLIFSDPHDDGGISTSETVNVNVRKARSTGDELEFDEAYDVTYKAFEEEIKIRVRRNPIDRFKDSIFSDDFKFLSLNMDLTGDIEFYDEPVTRRQRQEAEDSIYVDSESHTAVQISKTENGTKLYGIVAGHSVIPWKEEHIVRKTRETNDGFVSDYVDLHREFTPSKGRTLSQGTQQYYVETVIFFDYDNSKFFKHNTEAIVNYILILFKSVNMKFAALTDQLKITFIVSGIIICRAPNAQQFFEAQRVANGIGIDIYRLFNATANWVYAQENWIPAHDAFVLITAVRHYDFHQVKKMYERGNVIGLGGLGAVCWSNSRRKRYEGVAVCTDIGGFWHGINHVAHELSHVLGSSHDGEGHSKKCPRSDGYFMGENSKNSFRYSTCSIESIKKVLESEQAKCTRISQSRRPFKPSAADASQLLSFKGLCIKYKKNADAFLNPESNSESTICQKVWCNFPKGDGTYIGDRLTHIGENFICAKGKRCRDGECVAVTRIGTT